MIHEICKKETCTACFACENICPQNAVKIKSNSNGLFYPEINESCIECNLCKKICPSNTDTEKKYPQKTYAVYSNNDKIRRSSASGGAVYQIADAFDGIVYGAAFTKDLTVEHIRIENKCDLHLIQGSKYVHSHINKTFRSVKNDIESGLKVLFTGTPCQVAGLKSFLLKDYKNLYTIDIICHGVPEQKVLKDYIKKQVPNINLLDKHISFRENGGWLMQLKDNNDKTIKKFDFNTNYYMHGFLEGWIYRENCYNCKYACPERCSDLTVGDFWGISPPLDKELKKGLNAVLVITGKGNELVNMIRDTVFIAERETDEAISNNGQLKHPSAETKHSKKFRKFFATHGANYALKNTKFKKRIIFTIKNILKK